MSVMYNFSFNFNLVNVESVTSISDMANVVFIKLGQSSIYKSVL